MIIARLPWLFSLMVLSGLHASKASGGKTVEGANLPDASANMWNAYSANPEDSEPVPYWFEAYDLTDPAQIFLFYGAQTAPANLNDTFPKTLGPRLNPFDPEMILKRCERADVAKCLTYGEPPPSTGQIPSPN